MVFTRPKRVLCNLPKVVAAYISGTRQRRRRAVVALLDGSHDGDTVDGDELGVRVIGAPGLDLGAAACSRTTDDGDVSAVKTDDLVGELVDDAEGLQDSSSSGVAGSGEPVAAHIAGGGGSAVATSGCGDRKSGEGKSLNEDRQLHPCVV
jgi:hypothetical protein